MRSSQTRMNLLNHPQPKLCVWNNLMLNLFSNPTKKRSSDCVYTYSSTCNGEEGEWFLHPRRIKRVSFKWFKSSDYCRSLEDSRNDLLKINLSSWQEHESYTTSMCEKCQVAEHKMNVCSLVPSKYVLPKIKAVIFQYLKLGYDNQSVVEAVKDAFAVVGSE